MKLVTITEAARELGCSRQNIYQLIKKHDIPTEKRREIRREVVERSVEVQYIDLDALMELLGRK